MRASQLGNIKKSVVHVSGFFEDRGGQKLNGERSQANSRTQMDTPSSPEKSGHPPSGEQAETEASVLTGNALNAAVPLVASRVRTDVDLATDWQGKAGSSSSPAFAHQTIDSDVNTSGGRVSMGETEHLPMTLNSVFLPTSMGTYAEGDPFLAKLQEIDSDLQKFDHVPCEKIGCLEGQLGSQLQKAEGCQSREMVRLEDAADNNMSAKADISKGLVGPNRKEKDGVGPGPKKEGKKGQWTRLLSRLSSELMEEAPYGIEGPKRKIREAQA